MKNKEKGFTIFELLIVIAIIGLLSTTAFYTHNLREKETLKGATNEIVLNLKRVQQMSMGVNQQDIDRSVDCPNEVCYFGVNFDFGAGTVYRIYVDSNHSNRYDSGDKILKTVELPSGIEYFTSDMMGSNPNYFVDIVFSSPYGKVINVLDWFGGPATCNSSGECSLIVRLKSDTSQYMTIKVNKEGLIYVE